MTLTHSAAEGVHAALPDGTDPSAAVSIARTGLDGARASVPTVARPSTSVAVTAHTDAVSRTGKLRWTYAARLTASYIVVLGIATMIGWWWHLTPLLRLRTSALPMTINTALGLVLTGVAIVLATTKNPHRVAIAVTAGIYDLALAVAVFVQQLLGVDLHVDQLLADYYLTPPPGTLPGRVAVNTALCFLLVGAALVLWRPDARDRGGVVEMAAGIGVLAIAALALTSYMLHWDMGARWVGTAMALSTSIAMFATAAAIVALGVATRQGSIAGARGWLAAAAGVTAVVICGIGWQMQVGAPKASVVSAALAGRAALLLSCAAGVMFAIAVWYQGRLQLQRNAALRLTEELAHEVELRRRGALELAAQTRKLAQLNRELERSNDDLSQFAYAASHDLAEPLRAISGPLAMLQRRYGGQLDDTADTLIGFSVDGCNRMQTLIDDLLAFSRVGRMNAEVTEVDLNALMRDIRADLHTPIDQSGAVVDVAPLPTLLACRGEIRQVLQNLVGNAVKFAAPDRTPHVTVTAEPFAAGWRFAVSDNGIGIDPKYRQQVFGMFKRLHTRDQFPGTGIGLALAKKIVERHGGTIGIEDGPDGVGSTFWFTVQNAEEGQ